MADDDTLGRFLDLACSPELRVEFRGLHAWSVVLVLDGGYSDVESAKGSANLLRKPLSAALSGRPDYSCRKRRCVMPMSVEDA